MSPPPQQQTHEVNVATVAGAVASLTKWMRARTEAAPPNLLTDERDDLVLLQLSLRRVAASPTTKPHLLVLPHPVLPDGAASICVITDDRPKSRSPAASDLLDASKSHHLPVSEVIPLSTLRTDYRPYESRRRLAASHDLFLADRAVLPLLPRVLGKAFYSTKKAPIAVDFTRAGWPEQVRKVLTYTFLYLRSGTCSGIKVGRLDMKEGDIVENVMAAVAAAVEKVPKKWANLRSLHLKAVDSVALPIYQVVPELGMKIEVPVGRLEGAIGAGEVIDAAQVETGVKSKDKKKKKAFRYLDADGGEEAEKEHSGKRKRNKKEQTEDVMMEEEVQDKTEKRKKMKGGAAVEVPSDVGQAVGKKSKGKSKRALGNEVDDSSVEKKKGKKNEQSLEEAINKKKKGKKEDSNSRSLVEVENDARENSTKGKKGGIKEEKKSMKGNSDDGEVLKVGGVFPKRRAAKERN